MRYLILLLISFSVHAEYRVNAFEGFCDIGCPFETLGNCKRFLLENHPSKPESSCEDISLEIAASNQLEENRRSERLAVKAMVQKINDSNKQPWEKKLLKVLIRDALSE